MRTCPALALVLCCAASAQSPIIRSETKIVLVDAVVTDKKGAYVHDLTAKDFRIWEDSKEQTIQSFSLESAAPAQAQRDLIVLVFDFGGMDAGGQIRARQAAGRFIDANTGPNRSIAIANLYDGLQIVQGFSDNAGRLKEAVVQAKSEAANTGSGAAIGRGGGTASNSSPGRDAIPALRGLSQLASNLSQAPGRKTIVLFTGNLTPPNGQKDILAQVAQASNRANAAIYPVDVRDASLPVGVDASNGPGNASMSGMMGGSRGRYRGSQGDQDPGLALDPNGLNQDFLFALAGATGGFVVRNSNEITAGLQKIGEEQQEYYLLGYSPSDSPSEPKAGACHALRVKLNRGGLTLRARSSYCNEKQPELVTLNSSEKNLEQSAKGDSAAKLAASLQLPFFYAGPGVARVKLAMEIPVASLHRNEQKAGASDVNILGIASTKDGDTAARFTDTISIAAAAADAPPLHYEKEFKIAPGQYNFTLAFGGGDATLGKIEQPLIIEPYEAGRFAISGIALSKELRKGSGDDASLGAKLFDDRTPLTINGVGLVPSGSAVFDKSGKSYGYFEVYTTGAVTINARALNATTGDAAWDGGSAKFDPPPGKSSIPIGLTLPVSSLAPGAYVLEIAATDAAGKQLKRTTNFEIK